jgi:hypothetical protein
VQQGVFDELALELLVLVQPAVPLRSGEQYFANMIGVIVDPKIASIRS